MTEDEQTFESWKYSRRMSLVYLDGGRFALAGPDLKPVAYGTLEELESEIKWLALQLHCNPHVASPPKPVEEVSLDYLTEIEL